MTALTHIAAYLLGALSFGAFMLWLLVKLHPKATPPVLRRRANRDRLPEVRNVPPMSVCKPAKVDEVGGIRYEHLGMTGEEV